MRSSLFKIRLTLVSFLISMGTIAQDFQGKAYYFSKSTMNLGTWGAKMPEAQNRVPMIKQRYDELWNDVSDADRERASVKFVPDMQAYR